MKVVESHNLNKYSDWLTVAFEPTPVEHIRALSGTTQEIDGKTYMIHDVETPALADGCRISKAGLVVVRRVS